MRAYIIKRLLLVIPTVLLTTIILFIMLRMIPGDIVDVMVQQAHPLHGGKPNLESLREAMGLDVPIYVQYGRWVGVIPQKDGGISGLLQGDLGDSLWTKTPVSRDIAERVPLSIQLGVMGILSVLLFSLPIGIYSAIRQDSFVDYGGRSFATILIAVPGFWMALMVILVGSIWFGISPTLRYTLFVEGPIESLKQFIIPALVLGMAGTGGTTRLVRAQMLDVLRQDYIRTAWAKGLKERAVVVRHALRNVLIPIITMIGGWLPPLIGGTVIIETVFGMPGMGRLLVDAIADRDYNMVSGIILVYAIVLVVINLVIDLSYGYLDPRVVYK